MRSWLSRIARPARVLPGTEALGGALENPLAQVRHTSSEDGSTIQDAAPALPRQATFLLPDGTPYTLSVSISEMDPYRNAVAQGGAQEADWRFCLRWLRPGNVFFDVGANIGTFAIPASVLGAEVHAFELLAENVTRLLESAELNTIDTLHLTLGAIWSTPGAVGFAGHSAWGRVESGARTLVAAIRLDDYVEQQSIGRVDMMKMDLEGAELAALNGASALIERDRPDILIESNALTCGGFGYSYREMLKWLTDRQYHLYRLGSDRLHPWQIDTVQEIVQADYFATVCEDNEVAVRSHWPICPLSTEEQTTNILGEDQYSDYHRMHLLAIRDQLPDAIRLDGQVAAMLDGWSKLIDHPQMRRLHIGTSQA